MSWNTATGSINLTPPITISSLWCASICALSSTGAANPEGSPRAYLNTDGTIYAYTWTAIYFSGGFCFVIGA